MKVASLVIMLQRNCFGAAFRAAITIQGWLRLEGPLLVHGDVKSSCRRLRLGANMIFSFCWGIELLTGSLVEPSTQLLKTHNVPCWGQLSMALRGEWHLPSAKQLLQRDGNGSDWTIVTSGEHCTAVQLGDKLPPVTPLHRTLSLSAGEEWVVLVPPLISVSLEAFLDDGAGSEFEIRGCKCNASAWEGEPQLCSSPASTLSYTQPSLWFVSFHFQTYFYQPLPLPLRGVRYID